ncbi:hypothetical protein BGX20_007275, partial [Mortierella sp. AD010]
VLARKYALLEQEDLIKQDRPIDASELLKPLTKAERNHILRSHSTVPVRIKNTLVAVGVQFERRPDRGMAFICHCNKKYWTRDGLSKHYKKKCSNHVIPVGHPGLRLIESSLISVQDLEVFGSDGSDDETGVEDEVEEQNHGNGNGVTLSNATIITTSHGGRGATLQDLMDLAQFLERGQQSMEERLRSHISDCLASASGGSNPVNARSKRPYTGTGCTKPFKSPSRVIQTNDAGP